MILYLMLFDVESNPLSSHRLKYTVMESIKAVLQRQKPDSHLPGLSGEKAVSCVTAVEKKEKEETQVSNTHHEKCQFRSEIGK